jgi:hypothetical protein
VSRCSGLPSVASKTRLPSRPLGPRFGLYKKARCEPVGFKPATLNALVPRLRGSSRPPSAAVPRRWRSRRNRRRLRRLAEADDEFVQNFEIASIRRRQIFRRFRVDASDVDQENRRVGWPGPVRIKLPSSHEGTPMRLSLETWLLLMVAIIVGATWIWVLTLDPI